MKFGDICSNNEVVLKTSEISVADKVIGTAHTTVVCCPHS